MLTALFVILVIAAIGITIALFVIMTWQPQTDDVRPVFDWCEVCGEPATHELGGAIEAGGEYGHGGGAGMVACYCATDAPENAVKVR